MNFTKRFVNQRGMTSSRRRLVKLKTTSPFLKPSHTSTQPLELLTPRLSKKQPCPFTSPASLLAVLVVLFVNEHCTQPVSQPTQSNVAGPSSKAQPLVRNWCYCAALQGECWLERLEFRGKFGVLNCNPLVLCRLFKETLTILLKYWILCY